MNSHDTAQWKLKGLEWLLDDFASLIGNNARAALASQDGLVASFTKSLSEDEAEHLAAAASSLLSLSKATVKAAGAAIEDEAVRQVIIEHKNCMIFVMGAGEGSVLTVATDPGADVGRVGYEMTQLVKKVGEHLATPNRTAPEGR
ncbi:roadblock/LC7 domain-containing protein [Streptomyces sp. NPDC000594]|uniref:roadblock/LC7 domain-containing protein n=1 Tax=Streptomyces sp. NPDC000594 TaxID=3154261 RepID=UPI0033191E6E